MKYYTEMINRLRSIKDEDGFHQEVASAIESLLAELADAETCFMEIEAAIGKCRGNT